jgi:hypothetical protein
MGLGSEIRDLEKNLFRIPDPDPQYCHPSRCSLGLNLFKSHACFPVGTVSHKGCGSVKYLSSALKIQELSATQANSHQNDEPSHYDNRQET